MKQKELINPVQIGRFNLCPKCVTPTLYLVENNIDISYIDGNGDPIDYNNISHKSYLICSKCRTKYNYKKKGMKIFIYTDRERKINEAREILINEGLLDKYSFMRENTDSEEREDYI